VAASPGGAEGTAWQSALAAGGWNRMIMDALYQAEAKAGHRLMRNEVLDIVARYMKEYKLPMNFTRWGGR
jgi:hypothetical protein